MKQSEKTLAQRISNYLQIKHKNIIFRFDIGADVKLTMFQAKRAKQLQGVRSKGYPDLFIAKASNGYHGLFLELKVTSPFKKDGTLKKNEHLETQNKYHELLRAEGYKVLFTTGYDETVRAIEEYLSSIEN